MAPTGGDLADHDHEFDEVRWIPLAEAPEILTFETERALVARAAEHLGSAAPAGGRPRRGGDAGRTRPGPMSDSSTGGPVKAALLDEPAAPRKPAGRRHAALGARLIEFGGWLMPVQYGSIIEEHRAVRERAGLFDLSHMGELFVEGPEAGAALARALVSDPPALAVGRAQYSMICAPDGGILDDLIVYRVGAERFLVVANAGNATLVSDTLAERLEGSKAILDDRSLATALCAVQGPRSVDIVGPLTDIDLAKLRYYAIAEGTVAGIPAHVARTGYTGEDGFEVFVDTARAEELWDALQAAGGPLGHGPRGPGRPGHAAPRGRDAPVRQRPGHLDEPVRGRPRARS